MGLLAYKDPANSPLGHLVSNLQNQAIADKVNDAVLGENAARSIARIDRLPIPTYRSIGVSGQTTTTTASLETRSAFPN